jgi:hypothetical protein
VNEKNGIDIKIWQRASKDYKEMLENCNMDSQILSKYSLKYYFKKFFEMSLITKTPWKSQQKLPLLCARIKTIKKMANVATALLSDGTNEIKATFSENIVKDYWDILFIGASLLLTDVYIMRVNMNIHNCYHLNITRENVIKIHYSNEDDLLEQTITQFDGGHIAQLIDQFELKFDENKTLNDSTSQLNNTASNKNSLTRSTSSISTINMPKQHQQQQNLPQQPKRKSINQFEPSSKSFNNNTITSSSTSTSSVRSFSFKSKDSTNDNNVVTTQNHQFITSSADSGFIFVNSFLINRLILINSF